MSVLLPSEIDLLKNKKDSLYNNYLCKFDQYHEINKKVAETSEKNRLKNELREIKKKSYNSWQIKTLLMILFFTIFPNIITTPTFIPAFMLALVYRTIRDYFKKNKEVIKKIKRIKGLSKNEMKDVDSLLNNLAYELDKAWREYESANRNYNEKISGKLESQTNSVSNNIGIEVTKVKILKLNSR